MAELFAMFALAVALAMDATAVAAARGLAAPEVRVSDAIRVGLFFGGFQAAMPLLGFLLGGWVGAYAAAWDHWIAFGLLSAIGAKMIYESFFGESPEGGSFANRTLLVLALATSIDAFAAGISLAMVDAPVAPAVATIGIVTALSSIGGVYAGRRFGALLGRRLEVFGGVVLIALGVKILFEHLRHAG